MKKNYWLIILSLSVSLFIYLFYRTEKTAVNQLLIYMVSRDTFIEWRRAVASALPLNKHIIYSLPGGLWVFCITLTSKFLFIKCGNHNIRLLFLPLVFSIGLELLQLLHITNGRFDFWDIGFYVACWAAAVYLIKHNGTKQNILKPFTASGFVCILSYLIVYLAHVSK
ncbi:MAG TPA: hypothetical protein VG738_18965 [Chitinophagaceae bacterium]|nr:hypothetical protein [Chitinophagaceae bacterium]